MFDPNELKSKIANGDLEESEQLEFKSHLGTSNPDQYKINQDGQVRYQIKSNKKVTTFKNLDQLQQYFHFVNCIKPVCAFLNGDGGVLAIGFEDFLNEHGTRNATGLINETEKDRDSFNRELTDILETKLERNVVNNYIKVFFERVGSKYVCLIRVKKYDGSGDAIFVETFNVLAEKNKQQVLFVRVGNSSRELVLPTDIFQHGVAVGAAKGKQVEGNTSPTKPNNVVPIGATSTGPFHSAAKAKSSIEKGAGWAGPFTLLDCAVTNGVVTLLVAEQNKLVKCKFNRADDQPWYDASNLVGGSVYLKAFGDYKVEDGWFYQIKVADPQFSLYEKLRSDIISDPAFKPWDTNSPEVVGALVLKVISEDICKPGSVRYNWDSPFIKFTTERGVFYSLKCDRQQDFDNVPIGSANYIMVTPLPFEDLTLAPLVQRFLVNDISEVGP